MVLFLGMLTVPAAQAQQQRFTIVSGGQSCGTIDIGFEYLANGYVQCRYSERRNVVDRLGKQVEYALTAECLADSSLIPISIEARRKLGMQLVTVKGRVTDGILYVAEDYGDGRVERPTGFARGMGCAGRAIVLHIDDGRVARPRPVDERLEIVQ